MPPRLHYPYPAFSSLWEDEQVLGMTRAAKIFSPRPSGSQLEIASEAEDSEFTTEDVQTTSVSPEVQPDVSTARTETGAQWIDDLRHDYPLEYLIPVSGPSSTDATELRPPQSQSLPTDHNNNLLPPPRIFPIYPPPPTDTTAEESDSRRNSLGQIDTVISNDLPTVWTPGT
ncbi:hypothetical protein BFW01_g11124 [Lasiodiplodia theobromae]|nr:hypothetical protein BFW01_g11124 [Lasiodiplodia theobromae]